MTPQTQELVRRVARSMWRRLPAGHCVSDIEQEAMLGALKAPAGCQARGARFAIIEYLRREYPGSRSGRPVRYEQFDGELVTRPTQERRVIEADERERVLAAVEQLTAKELAVIRAVFFEGLTQPATAKRLRCSLSHVQVTQRRALEELRRRLAA
jgi:RNA polymerase sigma factor (sigma-70 family)